MKNSDMDTFKNKIFSRTFSDDELERILIETVKNFAKELKKRVQGTVGKSSTEWVALEDIDKTVEEQCKLFKIVHYHDIFEFSQIMSDEMLKALGLDKYEPSRERKAVLEYIQNLAVRFEKVQNEEMKLREEIYNNSKGPVLIPSSKSLINIWRMTDAFMNYTTSLGFTPEQIWAKTNGGK